MTRVLENLEPYSDAGQVGEQKKNANSIQKMQILRCKDSY